MELLINGLKMELNFGVRFVREVDVITQKTMRKDGIDISYSEGLATLLTKLEQGDITALSDLIYCALWKVSPRPSLEDVDSYLSDLTLDEGEKLFDDVKNCILNTLPGKLAQQAQKATQERTNKLFNEN